MLIPYIQVALAALTFFLVPNGFAMDFPISNELQPCIFANEADEDLEMNESSRLEISIAEFTAKGGILIRMDGETRPFQLQAGDVVFPACSAGSNRSQVIWGLLRKYEGISLQSPHATRYGFDPYNGKVNWKRSSHVPYPSDEFIKWSGVHKSTKFGWDLFGDWLAKNEATQNELALLTEYYNTRYYCPSISSDTRRIYITFAKNGHAHLHRLNQTNSTLENVFVLFYPLEDLIANPLPEWETFPRSFKTYANFAYMLEKYLDFSNLFLREGYPVRIGKDY